MKDYTGTITITVGIQAKNDEQAQDRAQEIADAIRLQWTTPTGKPSKGPTWVGDMDFESVEAEEA